MYLYGGPYSHVSPAIQAEVVENISKSQGGPPEKLVTEQDNKTWVLHHSQGSIVRLMPEAKEYIHQLYLF